jgi:hypothetical protein
MDYATLGLTSTATPAEVKRAYYKLALKYHPDRNPTGADEFRKVNEAYTRLAETPRDQSLNAYLREVFGNGVVDYVIHLGEGLMRETIHLSPTLEDLFAHKVFLYKREFPIPLWHHELSFDTFDVVCKPTYPEGVSIDQDNNVHVVICVTPTEVLKYREAKRVLGGIDICIPACDLKLVPTQTVVKRGKGIPRINDDVFLDTSVLSDLVVTVTFI